MDAVGTIDLLAAGVIILMVVGVVYLAKYTLISSHFDLKATFNQQPPFSAGGHCPRT